jgi:hypothetical protein
LCEADKAVSKFAVGRIGCPRLEGVREVAGVVLGAQLFVEELGVTTVQLAWVVAFSGRRQSYLTIA